MRWIPAKALDYVCVLSSTFSSLSLSLTSLLLPPTLLCVRFSFSVRILSFLDFRVHYQRLSFPCFQFIALASIILQRSRSTFPVPIPCRLQRFQSFVYLLSHLVSLTRHLNNMSPIATFLVSGLLPFVSASVRRLLSWGF